MKTGAIRVDVQRGWWTPKARPLTKHRLSPIRGTDGRYRAVCGARSGTGWLPVKDDAFGPACPECVALIGLRVGAGRRA